MTAKLEIIHDDKQVRVSMYGMEIAYFTRQRAWVLGTATWIDHRWCPSWAYSHPKIRAWRRFCQQLKDDWDIDLADDLSPLFACPVFSDNKYYVIRNKDNKYLTYAEYIDFWVDINCAKIFSKRMANKAMKSLKVECEVVPVRLTDPSAPMQPISDPFDMFEDDEE